MKRPLLAFALFAACLVGCAAKPKLVPVSGKVSFNGQPLTAGSVWLHPTPNSGWTGEKPSSVLQTDGRFTVRTYPHGDGVPPGSYKVTLSLDLAGRIKKPEYGDPAKTPWTLDVPDVGVKDHAFEVK